MSEKITNLTTDSLKTTVATSALPVLVDFWAPWCGPCKLVAPELEKLAAQYDGAVDIVKVNVDNEGQLAMDYKVTGIPLLGVFHKGEMVKQLVGARPKAALVSELSEYLG